MDKKTHEILEIFEKINRIPRCSKKEEKISRWLAQWASQNMYDCRKDSSGNINIKVPARQAGAKAPSIIIQGHMDMVCEKTDDSGHDFSSDPIRCIYDGEWLKADKTTLGADNGIAIAIGLALAGDPAIVHPPLELLFTVDEESGLTGAKNMDPEFLEGSILLNIDSEEEGIFTIGCAGGEETRIVLPINFSQITSQYHIYKLTAAGMRGGHSGIDINKHRASANKILARALHLLAKTATMELISIKGGTTHNAIARSAEATIALSPSEFSRIQDCIKNFGQTVISEYAAAENSLALSISQLENDPNDISAATPQDTYKIIQLLLALPHGVTAMSADIEDLVETSSNLAAIEIEGKSLKILTSQRSSVMSKLEEITAKVEASSALAGATMHHVNRYPAWQPNTASPLLERCKEVYQKLFSKDPKVQTIHAGLECGIIGSKHRNMDMISFGPTIKNPHSPDERLFIPSIAKIWNFLVALLKSYS